MSAPPDRVGEHNAVWMRPPHVAQISRPGRIVLLDLTQSRARPLILQDAAAVIWDCLDGGADEATVCSAVAEHFGSSVSEVRLAVGEFLADMAERGLLVARGLDA